MNIIDIIVLKYPGLQGITYWQTQPDGTPWDDPYDGLIWENTDLDKPSKKDLENWEKDVSLLYKIEQVREQRKTFYPSLEKQLDMQYWDKVNGTNIWQETIQAIKEANPIPIETTPV